MKTDNMWFGIALYSPHIDENGVEDWIKAVLVESGANVCGVQLVQMSAISSKWRAGKPLCVDERNLKSILKRCAQGKISYILGENIALDPNANLTGRQLLYFRTVVIPGYSEEARNLTLIGPKKLYHDAEVIACLHRLVSRFPVDYGFIAAGLSELHADATVTFTHSAFIDEYAMSSASGPDHPRKLFAREISYYPSPRGANLANTFHARVGAVYYLLCMWPRSVVKIASDGRAVLISLSAGAAISMYNLPNRYGIVQMKTS